MTEPVASAGGDGPVVLIAGGVGAARFLEGLVQAVPPADVCAVVNVGDDLEIAGLHISPDLDTVTYTLAGLVNPETGWGIGGDTFVALERLRALGGTDWFTLGDADLGTHLYRTERLLAGAALSEVTADIARAAGLGCRVVPATDGRLRTMVQTDGGELPFQEYFVRRRQQDVVRGLRFDGAETVEAAPGVHEAITQARAVVIAPSNPFLSIGPVLAVPGLRDCLLTTQAPVVAVSPIVAGAAIKGPTAAIMESMGHDVSALGVARLYADLIDVFMLDAQDGALAAAIKQETGVVCVTAQTIMRGPEDKRALAEATLTAAQAVVSATA
jgi:LPPG:FO 2-phospho-L-lactate transferase